MANYLLSDKKDFVDFDSTLNSSLTEWKESNFGSGTYDNEGNLVIQKVTVSGDVNTSQASYGIELDDFQIGYNNAGNRQYSRMLKAHGLFIVRKVAGSLINPDIAYNNTGEDKEVGIISFNEDGINSDIKTVVNGKTVQVANIGTFHIIIW